MEAGTPDILACVPCEIEVAIPDGIGLASETQIIGRFVGIETKMPDKRPNVSSIQERRHEQIRDAHGVAVVVTSVQEAVAALLALGWVRRTDPDA
jgi:hypothetical protein